MAMMLATNLECSGSNGCGEEILLVPRGTLGRALAGKLAEDDGALAGSRKQRRLRPMPERQAPPAIRHLQRDPGGQFSTGYKQMCISGGTAFHAFHGAQGQDFCLFSYVLGTGYGHAA